MLVVGVSDGTSMVLGANSGTAIVYEYWWYVSVAEPSRVSASCTSE